MKKVIALVLTLVMALSMAALSPPTASIPASPPRMWMPWAGIL